ncbi:MAG: cysteine protease StiP family protein [Lachnospiraceae bacterium]
MRSSYKDEDVIILLKDITGLVEPQSTQERERFIQAGRHYCEMLPIEYVPTETYMQIYQEALQMYAKPTALAVRTLAEKILKIRGNQVVLVSLARAGIPIGILLRRFIRQNYHFDVPHYSISIIRGRGIDENAMKFLLTRYQPQQLLFVDGWIGKGAILKELQQDIGVYQGVSDELAVLADPANVTELCGTHEDILIPSSCLNSTVSGLISRTFLRNDIIGKNDFHGAVYYEKLESVDVSYSFIEAIEVYFNEEITVKSSSNVITQCIAERQTETFGLEKGEQILGSGWKEVMQISRDFGVENINFIKPGIGETTRVLLRRVPWKVLIDRDFLKSPELRPILRLAQEKNVPIEIYPLYHYKCCGIIKKMADL